MYNVHLPIMLESERQAVYRERKERKVQIQGISFFLRGGGGGSGIEGVLTPSPKPWFVHGNYTEDFQNERKNALERHIAR